MNKSWLIILFFSFSSFPVFCQDQVQVFIKEAQEFYGQKNYKQAQMSLQDAINELNKLMSDQLADVLPGEINGLKAEEGATKNANLGALGGGTQISKEYKNPAKEENEAEVQLFANSPMLNAISVYMGNPAMMGEGAKSIRVGTQRAILKTEMIDYYGSNDVAKKISSTQIHIPLSQTLITIQAKGFASEQEEIAFAAKLDFQKIKTVIGE